MIKVKNLFIILVLCMFLFAGLTVCVGNESTSEVSIYNSTSFDPELYLTSVDSENSSDSEISIYNLTNTSLNDSLAGTEKQFAEVIEYKKVPIDKAYSKNKLQNINVSNGTLEAFSRFELFLAKQNVDPEAENISIMYIDDDLRAIENYWIFAARPESKERRIEKIQNSKSTNPSSEEMIAFLKQFDEKYPVKYVHTGVALFITVENKDVLLSEISKEDIQMLQNISNILLNESSVKSNEIITSNWGSSNPNLHGDMSGWAAEKAGFSSNYANIISNNAAAPDFFSTSSDIIERNYNHYYNPTFFLAGLLQE